MMRKKAKYLLFVAVPLFVAGLVFFITYLFRRRLFLQLEQVDNAAEEAVTICCNKVKFMLCQSDRISRTYYILCVLLLDEQGETYYYVQSKVFHQSTKKELRARYLGKELKLICYRGTKLVKEPPQEISKNFEKVEKNT